MHFGKLKRTTMTEDIIKTAKKNTIGPGQYPLKDSKRVKGIVKSTDRKSVAFIDDAEFKAKNMPGFYKPKHSLVEDRITAPDFKKLSKEREVTIKKKKGLAPNSYNYQESFSKTQVIVRQTQFLKGKRFVDFERKIKLKAYVPPPGHYDIFKAEKYAYKRFGPQKR